MKRIAFAGLALLGIASAQTPASITVPREKISLLCTDSYFKE